MKNGACDAMRSTPIFIGVSSAAVTARTDIVAATITSKAVTRVGQELRTRVPRKNLVVGAKIRGNERGRNLAAGGRAPRHEGAPSWGRPGNPRSSPLIRIRIANALVFETSARSI